MKKIFIRLFLSVLFACFLFTIQLIATTNTFTGTYDWGDPARWAPSDTCETLECQVEECLESGCDPEVCTNAAIHFTNCEPESDINGDTCTDGEDNDVDGLTDCEDPDCDCSDPDDRDIFSIIDALNVDIEAGTIHAPCWHHGLQFICNIKLLVFKFYLWKANEYYENGNTDKACKWLQKANERSDGDNFPKRDLIEGPGAIVLNAQILAMMEFLGCAEVEIRHADPIAEKYVKVYPNPASDRISIPYQVNEDGGVIIRIFNVNGQEVATLVNTQLAKGNYSMTQDISDLPSGLYILNYQTGRQSQSIRIIKM